jgi:formylglycine-generating enzyme required for sulfatase activity
MSETSTTTENTTTRDVPTDRSAGPMISIPGGRFLMGSTPDEIERCVSEWTSRLLDPAYTPEKFRSWLDKETPAHSVDVRPFEIGKYPVTNGQYRSFLDATGGRTPESLERNLPEDHPVWGVTVEEAERFAAHLREISGEPFRLPTEAEWEYAARGPERREYPYGEEFDADRCNTVEAGIGTTTPVDRYPEGASAFGVRDMAGNVEEWVADLYRPYPGGNMIEDDLVEALGSSYRVLRGGSFARGGDLCRCARRHGPFPAPEFRFTGFRLARSGGSAR